MARAQWECVLRASSLPRASLVPWSEMEVGRLLALSTATPAPMDILVSPWVAQRICPVGTHVLLEYGVSCTEAAWPPSVVGMAQGPSPLFSTLALLVMLCNFQWRYSRFPPLPHCQQISQDGGEEPALVPACRKLRCVLSQVSLLPCAHPSSVKWGLWYPHHWMACESPGQGVCEAAP